LYIADQRYTVVIEWHSETLSTDYNQLASEVVDHSSVKQEHLEDASFVNYTSLDDCLVKFHKPEALKNELRCVKCNDVTHHLKKLDVFRPPPILFITLKRFRQVGTHWKKV
jgi:ubiquitin C-terminal hydrolase